MEKKFTFFKNLTRTQMIFTLSLTLAIAFPPLSIYTLSAQTVSGTVVGGACAGSFTLSLSGTTNGRNDYSGTFIGYSVIIEWTGSQWQIRILGSPTLLFTNSSNTSPNPPCSGWVTQSTCAGGAITVSGGNCIVLSVELVSFDGKNNNGMNELSWKTANETSNKGFQIEYSIDDKTWKPLGFIAAQGKAATYTFTDANRQLFIAYYRLRQVDIDGTETLSKVITIQSPNAKNGKLSVYPNPVGEQLTVITEGAVSDVHIFNLLGQEVLVGQTKNQIVDVSTLTKGTYFVKVGAEVAKFVKN